MVILYRLSDIFQIVMISWALLPRVLLYRMPIYTSTAVVRVLNASNLEWKELFYTQFPIKNPSSKEVREFKCGRRLEAEDDAEATEDCCSACCLAEPSVLYNPRPPAQGWDYPQWSECLHINHLLRKRPTA